jgi:hypothetical protein
MNGLEEAGSRFLEGRSIAQLPGDIRPRLASGGQPLERLLTRGAAIEMSGQRGLFFA